MPVFFRVEINKDVGTGHFFRCLIIAQELKRLGMNSVFLFGEELKTIIKILQNENLKFFVFSNKSNEEEELIKHLKSKKSSKNYLVADCDIPLYYNLEFQKKLKYLNVDFALITFIGIKKFEGKLIHNQNIRALDLEYSKSKKYKLLLGPKYCILRDEFIVKSQIGVEEFKNKKKNIIITFGGVDKPNRTYFTVKALIKLSHYFEHLFIVLGINYENETELVEFLNTSGLSYSILRNITNISDYMAQSFISINSGGLTCWENGILNTLNIVLGYSFREEESGLALERHKMGYYIGNVNQIGYQEFTNRLKSVFNKEKEMEKRVKCLKNEIGDEGVVRFVDELLN